MSPYRKYGLRPVIGDGQAAFDQLAQIDLVITDCDGTLLHTDKSLSAAAIDAVRRLHAAGVKFAVASSRPGKGMRHIVEALDVDLPFASYNGGNIVAPGSWDVLGAHKLPREAVETVLGRLAGEGIDAWVFIGDNWYLTNPAGTYVALERRTVGYDGVVVKRFDELDLAAVDKIVGSTADEPLLARIEHELQATLHGQALAALSQTYYLDITSVLANKGEAARELSRHAGVPLGRVAVLGDMSNDVPMFDVAGLAIAMGQASEAVQARACLVSPSNDEEGFAVAIDAILAARDAVTG
ncbi:Cof-type HAD-IIB family hydrolase [Caballeronia humi]|jgi:Cof subfamily protein (haloacid dehalogenase superfamily)|uniref:Cof-like hydrolase n=1 Tax=Caballeronia humi TaxID=326474 RepID=A0A158GJG4_9BURK|nr:Cof-type HAD-IIB family hydrolase [Caballeronia humi]SAL32162.1 Cof-like hydrolase [Caballeronia humi]